MRTHIDLFSGIGGFALAARWCGLQTVAFCERDEYCQRVLRKNFRAEVLGYSKRGRFKPEGIEQEEGLSGTGAETFTSTNLQRIRGQAPIIPDIFTFDGHSFDPAFILTGGFPCQPFSHAGKRRGAADDRAIWPEMYRVITENRPAWVIGENVAGLITMELDRVLADLENAGYTAWTLVIPACAVDAKHRRDRVWIVAHSESGKSREPETRNRRKGISGGSEDVPNTGCTNGASCGTDRMGKGESGRAETSASNCQWLPEPDVGRVAHGVSNRVDRLKGLGNSIVPQVAYEIMRAICASGLP